MKNANIALGHFQRIKNNEFLSKKCSNIFSHDYCLIQTFFVL